MAIALYVLAGINVILAFTGSFSGLNLGAAVTAFGMGLHFSITNINIVVELCEVAKDETAGGH